MCGREVGAQWRAHRGAGRRSRVQRPWLRRQHGLGAYQLHQKHHWCVSLRSACRRRQRRLADSAPSDSATAAGTGVVQNMRFCETNPNCEGAFFDVNAFVCVVCRGTLQNSIRVRLVKPNRFASKTAWRRLIRLGFENEPKMGGKMEWINRDEKRCEGQCSWMSVKVALLRSIAS